MVNEIIKKRKSIRRFDPNKVVTKQQIHDMLEAAMLAPSARNSRPWEFIVIQGRKNLDAIVAAHPNAKMMLSATAVIVVLSNTNFANHMWQQDCAAATQNILLQAAEFDIGTCWCGIYPNDDRVEIFKKLYSLPDHLIPFCVIAVGYSLEEFGSRGFYDDTKVKWIN